MAFALAGATIGLGLALLVLGLRPARRSLATELAALHAPPPMASPQTSSGSGQGVRGWWSRLTAPLGAVLVACGLPRASIRSDLAVAGTTVADHCARQAAGVVAGLALPVVLSGLAALTGVGVDVPSTVVLCLAGAAAGIVVPDVRVRVLARRRRTQLRAALAALLDLTVIGLSGGAGVAQALADAAKIGDSWATAQLRTAITTASVLRIPIWTSLAEIGERMTITELSELASTVGLAGSEGAKVRASLIARAAGMRAHELAATESRAQSATERMSLPAVALCFGFLLFIVYPALATILGGLSEGQ